MNLNEKFINRIVPDTVAEMKNNEYESFVAMQKKRVNKYRNLAFWPFSLSILYSFVIPIGLFLSQRPLACAIAVLILFLWGAVVFIAMGRNNKALCALPLVQIVLLLLRIFIGRTGIGVIDYVTLCLSVVLLLLSVVLLVTSMCLDELDKLPHRNLTHTAYTPTNGIGSGFRQMSEEELAQDDRLTALKASLAADENTNNFSVYQQE